MGRSSISGRARALSPDVLEHAGRLAVVDPQRLRQACLVRLLEEWAAANRLRVVGISSPGELDASANWALIVLNVGGASVLERIPQFWIRLARATSGHVPLVVMSEREERAEVQAAFESGARGFIVSSFERQLAFDALTFLRRGGSFFPASVVFDQPRPASGGVAPPEALEIKGTNRTLVRVSARIDTRRALATPADADAGGMNKEGEFAFTPRQRQVLEHLSAGKPNKLIARELNMSLATVKVHVRQIMRKVGAANRTQAVLGATRLVAGLTKQAPR